MVIEFFIVRLFMVCWLYILGYLSLEYEFIMNLYIYICIYVIKILISVC